MNTAYRPQPAPFVPVLPFIPHQPKPTMGLSVGELLDVELGLFLLSQLLPSAPPDILPALLNGQNLAFVERPTWTPRQHKYLSRGRALLSQYSQQRTLWADLVARYAAASEQLHAYDISADGSRFREKTVGFFRNRIITIRHMLA